jgi:transketolase
MSSLLLGRPFKEVFGNTIAELADTDPRIVVLDGDLGTSTGTELFEAAHPDRFMQMGISEQNMLGVAAGLATVGFVPIVSSFACFVVGRAFDSIRVLIAQPRLNVKIVGAYTGMLTGKTGKTHQIFNDIAIMRSLAGIMVLAPADEEEARQAIRAMVEVDGPVYMQMPRDPSRLLFTEDYRFEIGRSVVVREGTDVTLISTGPQTGRVYEAGEILALRGIEALILHVPTIKPIDKEGIVRAAQATGVVLVFEEQSVLGGLGGAVAEVLSEHYPVPVKRFGIQDTYGESGREDQLLEKYRLSANAVAVDVQATLVGSLDF